jgi:hypothetical protein
MRALKFLQIHIPVRKTVKTAPFPERPEDISIKMYE